MAILSWGKCTIKHTSANPAQSATWTEIATPKEDTTKVTPTAGKEVTATEEGGDIVDARIGKTTFQFEFEHFVKKGGTRFVEDDDGVVAGEHAFRVIPEDPTCEGVQIDRCTLHVEESYSTADGIMLKYIARCLKPATGKTLKPYTEGAQAGGGA